MIRKQYSNEKSPFDLIWLSVITVGESALTIWQSTCPNDKLSMNPGSTSSPITFEAHLTISFFLEM